MSDDAKVVYVGGVPVHTRGNKNLVIGITDDGRLVREPVMGGDPVVECKRCHQDFLIKHEVGWKRIGTRRTYGRSPRWCPDCSKGPGQKLFVEVQCLGKNMYDTRKQAKEAAARIKKLYGSKQAPYQCKQCGYFHLTRGRVA